ncbi:MAG TPA: cation diffusion facilitator family transporter [Polyangia bacterium]|jgi:cation diffusion facilitator family transporter
MPENETQRALPTDQGGLRTVVVALVANLGIAAAKFAAALFTGSSAMLAEAFHASADTGNQVFLLLADRLGRRPPDEERPMGHGREAYFWSLLASLGVFVAGALLSLRQGLRELLAPTPLSSISIAYVVLVVSFVLDGFSLLQAYRQIRTEARTLGREFLEHLDLSSDPVARAVFAEDAVALLGNVVALAGILLHQVTGSPVPDAVAALVIGVSLAVVALNLARRNRDFLIGQEAPPDIRKRLHDLIVGQPGITAVGQLLVTFLGPRRLWVVARIDIDDQMKGAALKTMLRATEKVVLEQSPAIVRVDLVPRGRD